MPNKIKLLDQDLINKIAAGEVVERPSSVVKELVENSIDAGADKISITLENGGINYIEVRDNGEGMTEEDAKLSLVAHATSKISNLDDLSKILTMGFRGEALASISSVANTTIETIHKDSRGVKVTQSQEKITSIPSSINIGTKIVVKDLFGKIPARKKFLKSENSEYRSVLSLFIKIALINNNIKFELIHNDKLNYRLEKSNFEERIYDLFPDTNEKLIDIFYSDPEILIEGFIGHPSVNRKDRKRQFLFVNKRPINNALINQAIKSGYGTNLMQHDQPVYFINIKVPPDKVDINIHPRKDEVRFINEQIVFKSIYKTVRHTLEENLRNNYEEKIIPSTFKPIDTKINSLLSSNITQPKSSSNDRPTRPTNFKMGIKKSIDFTQGLLELAVEEESNWGKFMQIFKTYIITENESELMIIDQHAAAERITFEKIHNKFENNHKLPSQQLLIPEDITISQSDIEDITRIKKSLERLGFEYRIKSNNLQITSVPDILKGKDVKRTFNEIMQEMRDNRHQKTEESNFMKKIISTIACHSSIRAGQEIDDFQAKQIIQDLLKCNQPYSCPHGRPIIWSLDKNEIERKFKRKI